MTKKEDKSVEEKKGPPRDIEKWALSFPVHSRENPEEITQVSLEHLTITCDGNKTSNGK